MSNSAAPLAIDVDVSAQGEFPGAAEYARTKIGSLARFTHYPASRAQVRLAEHRHRGAASAVVAQVNLEIRGRVVRAQVEADTALEAIDKVESRLRRRLEHLSELWDPHRGEAAAPPWRQAAVSNGRQAAVSNGRQAAVSNGRHASASPLTPADGELDIVRRKSFAMAPCTVDEAVTEMEMLDYDFHLFTEIGTGTAAVVYRGGPTGLRLALVAPEVCADVAPYRAPVTVSEQPVPCLREEDAVERMGAMNLAFQFFVDAAYGRAGVLYRRYDGQYALITPAG